MSEQQIDRDELRRRAAGRHTIFMRPEHLLPLLDQLDQAEADVKRLSWSNGHLADKYAADMEELRQDLDQAEARIQAVEDVLAAWHVEPGESGLADDLLRALDGDA